MSAVVDVEHISKAFGPVQAVRGLSFTVQAGEIFGLLGPNGAGKTTTLSIVEGLLPPDEGRVTVLGMDVWRQTRAVKQRIGVQLQQTSLINELRVGEQVELFGQLYGYALSASDISELLELVGLSNKADAFPDTLSGGQKKRLTLALALVNRPQVLFLDEPTTGLDPQARRALWDLVRRLRDEGVTVVVTTHYMEEAETLCDRVGIIDHGQLLALGTPRALVQQTQQANLEEVFLHLTGRRIRE